MTTHIAGVYLESCLAPFASHLAREDVTDIYVNRAGELWIEALGKNPERFEAPELTHELLGRLARQMAAASAQGISREHPLLGASLPTGERVQVIIPPATRGEIVVAIRKHVVADMGLQQYGDSGAFAQTTLRSNSETESSSALVAQPFDGEAIELLRDAVQSKRTILISGGTASGKTTFLNALLQEISIEERLVFIEDTPELKIRHPNAVGLIAARSDLSEAQISTDDLLVASLRLRPDRIIVGELRSQEAVTFLRAANTGHPGSLSTIHADTAERAIDQLALLILQAGVRMTWGDVVSYIRRTVDVIVQLSRVNGTRVVSEILKVR